MRATRGLTGGCALGATMLAGFVGVATTGAAAPSAPSGSGPAAVLRVDSVGFLPHETKSAYLMTHHSVSGASFTVEDSHGATALSGAAASASRGKWSSTYPHVYLINFSKLQTPGTYAIHVTGPVSATSQTFQIESATALDGPIISNGIKFLQTQRDGADQIAGPLHRKPSHLNDARARVYKLPHFSHPCCNDRILGNDLHRVPNHAPTNVEGGWFDAGDFLKFTHTAAYADLLLYASDRALGHQAPAALTAEAQHGERWLAKMWDQKSRTLYLQVGIGSGNNKSFYGDHDLWRLPQADDSDSRAKDGYAAAHRPVFRAATPGKPISPNLAGRVSAAFALAAQVDATSHRGRARHELRAATSLYRLANTRHPPRRLVTAAPYGYYPENSWHDDMALGGAEIALAEQDLGHRGSSYLKAAATWAKAYIRHDASSETFNLYDTSALAETDLIRAIQVAGSHAPRLAISPSGLLHDLRRQIKGGIRRSQRDPFRAGGFYNEFDVDSHTAGMIATVAMYDRATHSAAYESFATEQRDWLFGANPWGASFMVGEGSSFPRCMQHQVANLAGSLDGSPPLAVGAVVNGPNDARIFKGGLGSLQQGVRRCPADRSDPYRRFNGRGSRYLDDTRSWQTSEPAIDMTSTAIIAAALAESG